jgi:flagellar biosynthetic protein FlhB
MAEDTGDKTEAPTPRRREEAREQGQIARSQDLTAAALLLGSLLLLKWSGDGIVGALKTLVAEMLDVSSATAADKGLVDLGIVRAVGLVARAMAPLMVGLFVLSVVINVVQVGFHLHPKRVQPNFAALNPLKGLQSLFGKRNGGPVRAGMVLLKTFLIAMVAYSAIADRIGLIITAQQLEFVQIFGLGADILYSVAMRIGILLLILAILDFGYQKWRIEQQLKMTKQEVKDEMRRMDGDPKIKQRRRQIAHQLATQKLRKDVPTADVIVTNPTHFAVALKYDSDSMRAPRVVAKGQDFMALRIREIAAASGVPILERPPLARSLYSLVQVGQEIPEQFYSTVAEILAYVYELSGKSRSRQTT